MELKAALQKRYGAFFLDADFTVEGGRIGMFGPSGSGKSALVGLIAGLHHPDRGLILLDGETLFDSRQGIDVRPERRRISVVFQRPHLFPHLSVKGNLLYGYKRCGRRHRNITFESVVDVLKIGNLLTRGVKNLSGGERQRVAIGRAVLSNPRLLVMDEPLSALDDALKFQIIPFIKHVCQAFRIPYLFISHSLLEIRIMTDQLLSVAEGRIVERTTAEDLARAHMGEAWGHYTNLLRLTNPRPVDGYYAYRWGRQELFVSAGGDEPEALFELSSTDIMLFKRHPEATSARNLLRCAVVDVFEAGNRIGVELECAGERLMAQVTSRAARELLIAKGSEIYAAIKAVAFNRLG
jgi:molybdate transport system ATP-binding protein